MALTQQDVQNAQLAQQQVEAAAEVIKKLIEGKEKALEKAKIKNKQWEAISKKLNKKAQYKSEIDRLSSISLVIINLNHDINKGKLERKYKFQYITEEEYNVSLYQLEKNYNEQIDANDKEIKKYQELLANLDPTVKQKSKKQKQKVKKTKTKTKLTAEQKKAGITRLKSLAKSGALIILPFVIDIATKQIIKVVTNIDELNSRIDSLNDKIDIVNSTPNQEGLNIVIAEKNSILNQINSTEKLLASIRDTINQINLYLQIFNISLLIANTLLSFLPSPPAPAIGFPAVVEKIRKIIDKATKIAGAISIILPILLQLLDVAINDLEDIKLRIKDIEDKLEGNLTKQPLPTNILGTLPGSYNGFKFAIKEETTPGAPTINGLRRHYGVAIDTSGVEVLKTDLSFTQDTEVLTDQLKFIIDSQNLKA